MPSKKKNEIPKKKHISYSQISTGRCKLRYKHLVLLEDIKEDSIPMRLGRLVHNIIAEYSKTCVKEKLEADYELMEHIIDRRFSDSGLGEEYFKQVRESCIRFGERGFNYSTLLMTERYFSFSLGYDKKGNDMKVVGIVDRVNAYEIPDGATVDIIDYKNQRNIVTEDDVLHNDQLNLYAFWFFMHEFRDGFFFGRTGIYHVPYSYTRWSGSPMHVSEWVEIFDNTEKWLIRQWERLILSNDYRPTRGPWCFEYSGCPVMKEGKCPLWTEEEVEAMRRGTLFLDKVRTLRKTDFDRKVKYDEVKELSTGGGNLEVDGQMVGFEPQISYKYDLLGLLEWLAKFNVIPDGLTVNKTDAERIIKAVRRGKAEGYNGELITEEDDAKLEALKIETASSRFVF